MELAKKIKKQLSSEFEGCIDELLKAVEYVCLNCGGATINVNDELAGDTFFARDFAISIRRRYVPVVVNELCEQGFKVTRVSKHDLVDRILIDL